MASPPMQFPRALSWLGLLAALAVSPVRSEPALALLQRQAAATDRLAPVAEATADAILGGHQFFLAGDPIWVGEGSHRAGGTLAAQPLTEADKVKAGDVVWLATSTAAFPANLKLADGLEQRGATVVYFGPLPPPRRGAARPWISSLTDARAPDSTALLGNILSLWAETGELAAALARRGHTLEFMQSRVIYGSLNREKFYPGPVWHDRWPSVPPLPAGAVARDYLAAVADNVRRVQSRQGPALERLAHEIARRAAAGHPAVFMASGGHVMPRVLTTQGGPFLYREAADGAGPLEAALNPQDLVVFFGYVSVPRDLLGAVHRAGAKAVWIVSPLPQDGDVEQFGDVLIDQGWTIGDAAVRLPGYDIRVLPPSGVVELVILRQLLSDRG